MDITVSTPGSPGTSFTEDVKETILTLYDVLQHNAHYASLRDLGTELNGYGKNRNYIRNILPFLRNCGILCYQDTTASFTNIGHAYADILHSIRTVRREPESALRDEILGKLEKIQEGIYFQCLVIMMKNPDCNYGYDFFDVLCFVHQYGSIDSTEYLLIQHERAINPKHYLTDLGDTVRQYRDGSITINVKTKTKNNESGDPKKVNSFPYVSGNFTKSGVFDKGKKGRFYIVQDRMPEITKAIQEVRLCLNSAKRQSTQLLPI